MPLSLTVTGADFSGNNIGRVVKLTTNRTNLVGEFIFGRNAATTIINGVDGGASLAPVGAPTYGDHRATVGHPNYFNTGVPYDAANLTLMSIVAPGADAAGDVFISNDQASPPNGQVAMYTSSPGVPTFQFTTQDGSPTSQTVTMAALATPLTDFRAVTGRIGTSGPVIKMDEFKGGVRVKGNSATHSEARNLASGVFHIGSLGSTALTGTHDVAAVLIWQKALSDAELLAAYLEVRTVLGGWGIAC